VWVLTRIKHSDSMSALLFQEPRCLLGQVPRKLKGTKVRNHLS
jgi:hypothetical protein